MMKLIQTLEIENTIFHIGKDENGYWGINHKYVEGLEAKKTINGLEGNCSEDYLITIRLCWLSVKRSSIAHLYDENNPKAWIEAFYRLEDEYERLGVLIRKGILLCQNILPILQMNYCKSNSYML